MTLNKNVLTYIGLPKSDIAVPTLLETLEKVSDLQAAIATNIVTLISQQIVTPSAKTGEKTFFSKNILPLHKIHQHPALARLETNAFPKAFPSRRGYASLAADDHGTTLNNAI